MQGYAALLGLGITRMANQTNAINPMNGNRIVFFMELILPVFQYPTKQARIDFLFIVFSSSETKGVQKFSCREHH